MSRAGIGESDQEILLTTHRLNGNGYSVSIAADVKERTGRSMSFGAIYTTLDRLEKKGLVASHLGEATPERGGKPKRLYKITVNGLMALSAARDANARRWSPFPVLESLI